jgi:hypothetical protein
MKLEISSGRDGLSTVAQLAPSYKLVSYVQEDLLFLYGVNIYAHVRSDVVYDLHGNMYLRRTQT